MDGRDVTVLEAMVCKKGHSHYVHYLANPILIFRPKNLHLKDSVLALKYCPDLCPMGPPVGARWGSVPKVLTHQEIWRMTLSLKLFRCCMLLTHLNNRLRSSLCCSEISSSLNI